MILFEQPAEQRITGKVVSSPMPGWWIVIDSQERKYRAASSESWRTGDRVVVVGGQIVDRAGKIQTPEVYQV